MQAKTPPKGYREGILVYARLSNEEREELDRYYAEELSNNLEHQEHLRKMKEAAKKHEEKEKWFSKNIWPKMSRNEQEELGILSLNGAWSNTSGEGDLTVSMGQKAIEALYGYKEKMIKKYKPKKAE